MSFLTKFINLFRPGDPWTQFEKLWPKASAENGNYSFHIAVNASDIFAQKLATRPPARLLELKTPEDSLQAFATNPNESERFKWNEAARTLILSALSEFGSALAHAPQVPAAPDEGRAIEWMRVSFKLLKEAIASCPQADERDQLAPSERFFSQSILFKKEGTALELRLIAFNLDIRLESKNSPLLVTIFNHKEAIATSPALKASLPVQGPAALEEIARILESSKDFFYWKI